MTALGGVKHRGEVVAYGFLAVAGAAAAVTAVRYGLFVEDGRVGPGLVPAVSGGLLAVLGVVLLLRTRTAERPADRPSVEEVDIHGRDQAARVKQLWTVFGLLLLTIVAVNVFGFLVAFGAFVFVVSAWVERRGLLPSAVTTGIACAVVYALFVFFLRVPLPPGQLGF